METSLPKNRQDDGRGTEEEGDFSQVHLPCRGAGPVAEQGLGAPEADAAPA